jgi:hypothetical protein
MRPPGRSRKPPRCGPANELYLAPDGRRPHPMTANDDPPPGGTAAFQNLDFGAALPIRPPSTRRARSPPQADGPGLRIAPQAWSSGPSARLRRASSRPNRSSSAFPQLRRRRRRSRFAGLMRSPGDPEGEAPLARRLQASRARPAG